MKDNFDLRKFLTENKLTGNSRLLSEEVEKIEFESLDFDTYSNKSGRFPELRLPAPDTADASSVLRSEKQLEEWKQEMRDRYGEDGYLEYNKDVVGPRKFQFVGNKRYDEWKDSYMSSKLQAMSKWGTN